MWLKEYNREEMLNGLILRGQKAVLLLTEDDYSACLTRAIQFMNEYLYTPRQAVIKNCSTYQDVTEMQIDTINAVYYTESQGGSNDILPEVGWLPLLVNANALTSGLAGAAQYLEIKSNINALVRQMEMDYDYHLYPPDDDGRQHLQLRKAAPLVYLNYLPHLDPEANTIWLFDHECLWIKDYAWALCNLQNFEVVSSAQILGVSKESGTLLQYWNSRVESLKKELLDKHLIEGIM